MMPVPAPTVPSRVLAIQSLLGQRSMQSVGQLGDALVFGRMKNDAAAMMAAPDTTQNRLIAPASAIRSVVNDDGTLRDDIPYADLFRTAGAAHGIQPALLAAVAKVESAFNPTAMSHAGAMGLMQFMPGTAEAMGVDPFDPASAVDGAARYLSTNLRRFGSLDLALAAYNAGPGAVEEHGGIPPFAETQAYVPKVLAAAGLS